MVFFTTNQVKYSSSSFLFTIEPISAVSLNRDGKPPILDQSFTLRCEVTGPVDYIHWLMNGQLISLNNRTFFSTGNKTMVINPIQFSDSGEYLCEAFNAVSNLTSMTYKLVVNCEYYKSW